MRGTSRWLLLVLVGVAGAGLAGSAWRLGPSVRHWLESRQKPIEDFTEEAETNLIGGRRAIRASADAQLGWALSRTNASPTEGRSCAITYRLPTGATGSWETGLNGLDISAARAIRFRVKAEPPMAPALHVELGDGLAHQVLRLRQVIGILERLVLEPEDVQVVASLHGLVTGKSPEPLGFPW